MKHFAYEEALDSKGTFVFAHGAGADMNSSFLLMMSKLLVERNISVIRFNFPYMEKRLIDGKKRPPDRMPALIADMSQLLTELNLQTPLFIGGKSMGSRVAASFACTDDVHQWPIKGVIAIGYPFHPIGKPEKLRLEPIEENTLPMLIIQGERDKLGSKDEIANYSLPVNCQIEFMLDGDHDIKPRVKSGFTHQEHIEHAAECIENFVKGLC